MSPPITALLADMAAGLEGRLLADKGYISEKRVARLGGQGLHLLTGIRWNREDCLRPIMDKILLKKRFIVETLFGKLTSEMGLEHTRHRSPTKAFVRILSCLVACTLGKDKIGMKNIAYPQLGLPYIPTLAHRRSRGAIASRIPMEFPREKFESVFDLDGGKRYNPRAILILASRARGSSIL